MPTFIPNDFGFLSARMRQKQRGKPRAVTYDEVHVVGRRRKLRGAHVSGELPTPEKMCV